MIKIENTVTPSPAQWEITILGARNAFNSWDRYDSEIKHEHLVAEEISPGITTLVSMSCEPYFSMGPNDHKMLMGLCKAGSDHRKFMRMLVVYANITAPLTWWKQEATYQVGAVRNSCSTMHKIAAKEFVLDDFSHENLTPMSLENLEYSINTLNYYRNIYLNGGEDECEDGSFKTYEPKDKHIWYQMIDPLPESYMQKRTVMYSYETLHNMYHARKHHPLGEWHELCRWIESLPYSELITGEVKE